MCPKAQCIQYIILLQSILVIYLIIKLKCWFLCLTDRRRRDVVLGKTRCCIWSYLWEVSSATQKQEFESENEMKTQWGFVSFYRNLTKIWESSQWLVRTRNWLCRHFCARRGGALYWNSSKIVALTSIVNELKSYRCQLLYFILLNLLFSFHLMFWTILFVFVEFYLESI